MRSILEIFLRENSCQISHDHSSPHSVILTNHTVVRSVGEKPYSCEVYFGNLSQRKLMSDLIWLLILTFSDSETYRTVVTLNLSLEVRLKPVCSATDLECWMMDMSAIGMILSRQRITGADQTAWMHRLICTFIVRIYDIRQVFSYRRETIQFQHSFCLWVRRVKLWRDKRICVFKHSVMTNFNCACPAIQRDQGSGFLSEGSSWLTACMSKQRRFWRDCAGSPEPSLLA